MTIQELIINNSKSIQIGIVVAVIIIAALILYPSNTSSPPSAPATKPGSITNTTSSNTTATALTSNQIIYFQDVAVCIQHSDTQFQNGNAPWNSSYTKAVGALCDDMAQHSSNAPSVCVLYYACGGT